MHKTTKIMAVIPANNEARHISEVVQKARQFLPVLVIDDGSTDETGSLAHSAGAEVLSLFPNHGKGSALRAGFQKTLEMGCEAVVMLDGDGQHDPAEIVKFLRLYSLVPADLIIGRRNFRKMPLVRHVSNTIGRWMFNLAIGQPVPDNQSGYRLLSRRLMEALCDSKEQGFEFEVEMVATCLERRFDLQWIPIRTIYSDEDSHIQPIAHVVNFFRIVWATYKRMRKPAEQFTFLSAR